MDNSQANLLEFVDILSDQKLVAANQSKLTGAGWMYAPSGVPRLKFKIQPTIYFTDLRPAVDVAYYRSLAGIGEQID